MTQPMIAGLVEAEHLFDDKKRCSHLARTFDVDAFDCLTFYT